MKQYNPSASQTNQPITPAKPILIGAATGLIIISFFLTGADNPNPEWGQLWMIRPFIIVPAAGAMGGLFYYFMDYLSSYRGLNRTVAFILSLVVFIIGLFLGMVLGLDGTYWN